MYKKQAIYKLISLIKKDLKYKEDSLSYISNKISELVKKFNDLNNNIGQIYMWGAIKGITVSRNSVISEYKRIPKGTYIVNGRIQENCSSGIWRKNSGFIYFQTNSNVFSTVIILGEDMDLAIAVDSTDNNFTTSDDTNLNQMFFTRIK